MSLTPATPRSREGERIAALGLVRQLQSAIQQDNRAVIVDLVRQLVGASAPLGAQWVPLSNVAAQNGEVNLARQAIDLYVAGSQGDPSAYYKKVGLLLSAGAWDEALALLRSLPVTVPDPASYAYSRGTVAMYVGELDEARHWLEEAIRQHPQIGSPWLSLSVLANFAQEPELADRIVAAERQMQAAVPGQRGTYYYALGKAHADLGDHARAFAGFERGARLLKGHFAYSRERDQFTARDAVNGYTSERLADLARLQSAPTGRAIFVMGLPRSGTTLVEQILTSHSAVADGGEICRLPLLVKDVGGLSYLAIREYVDKRGAPEAAALWHHWLDERFPSPGRVVDKTVNTTRLLGLAATLLPDAPLIWLVRDPLDCALSCFRTRFAGEAPWSYDLEDIAFHFRLEDELLAQWRPTLGERLLVVPYESLVADPPAWIGRILAHCGLAEEAQPFAPHENPRPVTTSSVMQVRRPINRQGIGSAEPYREFLEPFIAAYYR
ncbi:MAG: tetratricopeptide repeat-containing sulfotransferase family protein [Croceibacterium sp.]